MLLEIKALNVSYLVRAGEVKAVEDVTFSINGGDAVAIVGESGCGKSTLAHSIVRLLPSNTVTKGVIMLNKVNILEMNEEEFRTKVRWKKIAYVPQGSFNALNPVIKISDQIAEALRSHEDLSKIQAYERAKGLLNLVGIKEDLVEGYPHELSGGMKQRTVIAMALVSNPCLLVADEPTTALDVIVQAQIIGLIKSLIHKLGLSLLLITHDISLATSVCREIIVMYAGNMMEISNSKDFIMRPLHPYSKLLIDALPRIHGTKKKLAVIPGSPPDLRHPPAGCKFHTRCPQARKICQKIKPSLKAFGKERYVACHFPLNGG